MSTTDKQQATHRHIAYYRRKDGQDECHYCSQQMRGNDSEGFDWTCLMFDTYLGKWRAKRCQECIDRFGDQYRVKGYGTDKNGEKNDYQENH